MGADEETSPTILHSFAEQLEQGIAKGIRQGLEKGIEQGIEKGISLEKKNIAKRLIAEKMPLETIAVVTGLSLDEVQSMEQMIP